MMDLEAAEKSSCSCEAKLVVYIFVQNVIE